MLYIYKLVLYNLYIILYYFASSFYSPCFLDLFNKQWFIQLDHNKIVFLDQLFRYNEESKVVYLKKLKIQNLIEQFIYIESCKWKIIFTTRCCKDKYMNRVYQYADFIVLI